MKKAAFIIIISLLFLLTNIVQANQIGYPSLKDLERLADYALELSKAKRYVEASKALSNFEDELLVKMESGLFINMDEWRILQIVLEEARHVLNGDEFADDEISAAMAKFRLTFDAIISVHEPLWVQMDKQVIEAFQSVKAAASGNDPIRFRNQFQSFLMIYNIIYPSLLIDISGEALEKVDGKINNISNHLNLFLSSNSKLEDLEELENDLEKLFERAEEDEADPSLWWVIISTGGIIILSLIYTGWRKYKGEREKQRYFEKNHKN